jgi:hypothetical protein
MEIVEALKPDARGKTLENQVFAKTVFSDFSLYPPVGSAFTIRNVEFQNCEVSPGTCMIGSGTILEDVTFVNFECGDAMHIASSTVMRNVKIVGKSRPRMVWIRSCENASLFPSEPVPKGTCSFDISEYSGQVSITGMDVDSIRVNPELQVKMRLEKMNAVDWKSLGLGGLSYWRILSKKIASDDATEGVFSVPARKSRAYEEAMADLAILKSAAIL